MVRGPSQSLKLSKEYVATRVWESQKCLGKHKIRLKKFIKVFAIEPDDLISIVGDHMAGDSRLSQAVL